MSSRRRRFRYRPKPQTVKPAANEEITAPQVRLIGHDGEALGVVSTPDALQKAQVIGSDLVIVAAKADPPVARILDIGKHMYEKRKKLAKQKVKSKGKDIKGVRIGFKTDAADWSVRLKQADKFLQVGHKVKLEVRLRGREKQRFDLAEKRIKQFISEIPSGARAEDTVSRSHHGLSVLLVALK